MQVMEIDLNSEPNKIDLIKIKQYLRSLPFSFEDPMVKSAYIICGSKGSRDYGYKKMEELREKMGPGNYAYSCCVMHLCPTGIGIAFGSGDEDKEELKKFLNWVIPQYDFKITDDYGTDWTERIKKEGIDILFKQEKSKKDIKKVQEER